MLAETENAVQRIAAYCTEAPAPAAAEKAQIRTALIDLFGCILIGARQPVALKARSAYSALGQFGTPSGRPVYGTGQSAPPAAAAFLNGTAAHALDFDDWEEPGNAHPSAVLLPALLAAAPGPLSAQALMNAYAVGFDIIARLGEAVNFDHYNQGFHSTATLGALGAAGAVARLLNLSRQECEAALSIAASRALGFTSQFGSDVKPMQAGFAAETGVTAAHLAMAGLRGQSHVLDHPKGMFAAMGSGLRNRPDSGLDALGRRSALVEYGILFKPWTCCSYTHRAMTAALDLRAGGITADQIDRIEITLPDFHKAILPFDVPTNRTEALFSLPYNTAMALTYGDATLADLDRQSWTDPTISHLLSSTTVKPVAARRPDLNYDPDQPDIVRLSLKDGSSLSAEAAYPLGSPQRPMTDDQILRKFLKNAHIEVGEAPEATGKALEAFQSWTESQDILPILYSLGGEP